MALVRNETNHAITLDPGPSIGPGETANVDLGLELNADLLAEGRIRVTDGAVSPPAPDGKRATVRAIVQDDAASDVFTIDVSAANPVAPVPLGTDGLPWDASTLASDTELAAAVAAVGGRFRGAYASGTAYKAKDLVTQAGSLYSRNADGTPSGAFSAGEWTQVTAGSSSGHTIEDEGTPLTARSNLNFTGAGVTASDSGGKTVVTIPAAGNVSDSNATPAALNTTGAADSNALLYNSGTGKWQPGAVGGTSGTQQLATSGGINELLRRRPTADRWVPNRAISTKFTTEATKSVTGVAATGVFTTGAAHGYSVGEVVVFVLTTGGSGLTAGLPYYVAAVPSTTTFTVATTSGGSAITFSTDLTAGTVARVTDGRNWAYTNMAYTTSSGRTALRAADGGTSTFASLLTARNDIRNWDLRLRYRPANGTATGTTEYGPDVVGGWTDSNNTWKVSQSHISGNPNLSASAIVAGTGSSASNVQTDAAPRSTTQDRVVRVRKTGDLIQVKDWATNTLEPGWQQEARIRPVQDATSTNTSTDNPEMGQCGIYGQFNGAYFLDITVVELRRESENMLHNADFSRIQVNETTDLQLWASVNLATGVITTNTYLGASTNHGYSVGDQVVFGGFSVPGGGADPGIGALFPLLDYYVAAVPTSSTFTVSRTRGGSAITSFANASLPSLGVYCIRRPTPAYWHAPLNSALLSGNKLERVCVAGPDGSTRPALLIVCATPNDSNLVWTTRLWSPTNQAGDGSFHTRLQPHPQSAPQGRRLELSYWTKGDQANVGTDLGITFDLYIYDAYGTGLMRRQAYHPTLGPGIAADTNDPASYDAAAVASTWGWTYLTSIVELDAADSVCQIRCQILVHGTTTTTTGVYIMDPLLRPVG